jgi:hypothetical protein
MSSSRTSRQIVTRVFGELTATAQAQYWLGKFRVLAVGSVVSMALSI